jgi:hypothetical protein
MLIVLMMLNVKQGNSVLVDCVVMFLDVHEMLIVKQTNTVSKRQTYA